ncbi:putative repeat protein (TIGR03837 family) [Sulfuritortus calidifontis]|uniref:Protein-arginine rhamnosyltransferase n=1 Tax=Sulfuritortus calidifontis TaxID=1914471 RepID=A0A4R3JU34_9PROT|nr:elongation factor P maturation arginine rhamnosyltransferase EarP [Sulfuritortus calidifontis]TCS71171.1 putative repeat protein (TIGR03837 family) [Sulfuritortus calidifontis]
MPSRLACDIFCSVVDNYGDIGVAWRLARQLSREHGLQVRLWLDDLATLHRIWPPAKADLAAQTVAEIEVRHWRADFPEVTPAPLVIETFGCRLPENYLAAMSAREPRPLWLNLDHLSAEAWVKDYHGLPSPHPRLPLTAYFFYPGFEVETGGLIREAGLAVRRQALQADPAAREAFWRSLLLTPPDGDTLSVSLFAYDNPALPALLAAWVSGRQRVRCLVPEGAVLEAIGRFFGTPLAPSRQLNSGALEVCALPFFDQDGYDPLLWACDLNFVRGEDSFVRAQWAARPMVWNIYVQEAGAHWPKLHAFLDRYCVGLEPGAATAYRQFTEAWNRNQDIAQAWPALLEQLPALSRHSRAWAEHLAAMPDLASQLMLFCREKL